LSYSSGVPLVDGLALPPDVVTTTTTTEPLILTDGSP
jgi:hypothetical protein